jgi:hypothetical protein
MRMGGGTMLIGMGNIGYVPELHAFVVSLVILWEKEGN